MTDLKPCPFCGGPAGTLLQTDATEMKWRVWCLRPGEKCGAILIGETEAEVAKTWNRREGHDREAVIEEHLTPEILAGRLYDIMDQNTASVVAGDPREGYTTTIDGQWNLIEVCRAALAEQTQAPDPPSEGTPNRATPEEQRQNADSLVNRIVNEG